MQPSYDRSSGDQAHRAEELTWTKKRSLLRFLNHMINFVISIIVMLITYSTLVAGQKLTDLRGGTDQQRVDDELVFHCKELNLIVDPTGSGKTSLLMALLGEMDFVPSRPSSWVTRHRGLAYAAQESWILDQTTRDNILFGSVFDDARYKEALFQCALEPDLALLGHGDRTEVGGRGVTKRWPKGKDVHGGVSPIKRGTRNRLG
ncbi:hypothetical protein BS17DRAFT_37483 [Gyrodon lividus]|nr:hypothetical protein BS17DRAFT_37483 [Gyrodon lividus]